PSALLTLLIHHFPKYNHHLLKGLYWVMPQLLASSARHPIRLMVAIVASSSSESGSRILPKKRCVHCGWRTFPACSSPPTCSVSRSNMQSGTNSKLASQARWIQGAGQESKQGFCVPACRVHHHEESLEKTELA